MSNYPPTEEEVNSTGNPDYCTPPWEIEKPVTPAVYKPRPIERPEQDNWAGDPSEAWA